MDKQSLTGQWRKIIRRGDQQIADFDTLAEGVAALYYSPDVEFRQHLENRLDLIAGKTGRIFDRENFGMETARAFIADECGFTDWQDLRLAVESHSERPRPIIFDYAIAAMKRGDFTALEQTIGPEEFDGTIVDWYDKGYFAGETETLEEIFAAACMLGHCRSVEFLLDRGADPLAGTRTGLGGFHWAAASGRLEVVELLAARGVPMESENMYGGTVLYQALWSACNEHKPDHAAIVRVLIEAGALVRPGTVQWWRQQSVPSAETKMLIAAALEIGEGSGGGTVSR